MNTRIITRGALFVALLLLQILIFNHIHLLGYATPLCIIYYLILAPSDTPKSVLLLESFFIGLCMDTSTNTPGMAACALTFTAFLAPILLRRIAKTDRPDDVLTPSAREMGWWKFMTYATSITLIFITTYYFVAWFTLQHLNALLLNVICSSAITLLLIAMAERIHSKL